MCIQICALTYRLALPATPTSRWRLLRRRGKRRRLAPPAPSLAHNPGRPGGCPALPAARSTLTQTPASGPLLRASLPGVQVRRRGAGASSSHWQRHGPCRSATGRAPLHRPAASRCCCRPRAAARPAPHPGHSHCRSQVRASTPGPAPGPRSRQAAAAAHLIAAPDTCMYLDTV